MMMKINADRIAALCLLIAGIILVGANESLTAPTYDLLGSKFFPRLACLSIILLSILLLIFSRKPSIKLERDQREYPKPVFLFILLTIIYFLVLESGLGFLITTAFYLTGFIFLMSGFQWKVLPKYLGIGVASSFIFYYFFEKVLLLMLP